MAKKPYSPMAPYTELKRVEGLINAAQTIDAIRSLVSKDGPKVGYKAFCYMLGGKMTPEAMKPDEASEVAASLEDKGEVEKAQEIYRKILEFHPDHPKAKGKV